MVPRWRFLTTFLCIAFPANRVQHVTDLHLKFALRPHNVWKYGTPSATAEIRRGKMKERRRKKKNEEETAGQKYNGLPYSVGRP